MLTANTIISTTTTPAVSPHSLSKLPLHPVSSSGSSISLSCLNISSKLKSWSIKAMEGAETLSIPTPKFQSGKKQALISLSNKKDLGFLGEGLQRLGYAIVSTGGTATFLETAGVTVTKVEQITSFPEMLDGRVKTLHPSIHGGILARREQKSHMEALDKHGIGTFDIVVVNLYPFYQKVTAVGGIEFDDGIENIDIGGPSMIRAAAKNHKDVLVVVDPEDYKELLEFLSSEKDEPQFRRKLAWKAFQHCASYDSAVSEWLWKQTTGGNRLYMLPILSTTCG